MFFNFLCIILLTNKKASVNLKWRFELNKLILAMIISSVASYCFADESEPQRQPSKIKFFTEQYAPVSFTNIDNGEVDGMAVEIVRKIAADVGDLADIEIMPWARAYRLATEEDGSAVFTTIRTEEREGNFKWVGPILLSSDGFYALKDSGLSIKYSEELFGVRKIAVPRGWYTHEELMEIGFPNLIPVREPIMMFRLLLRKRVELIVTDNISFYTRGNMVGTQDVLNYNDVKVVFPYKDSYGYIAFNKNTDDSIIKRWQDSLDKMKSSGEFGQIYEKWLPHAKQP